MVNIRELDEVSSIDKSTLYTSGIMYDIILLIYHIWHHIVSSLLSLKLKKDREIKIENKRDLNKRREIEKKQVYYLWF